MLRNIWTWFTPLSFNILCLFQNDAVNQHTDLHLNKQEGQWKLKLQGFQTIASKASFFFLSTKLSTSLLLCKTDKNCPYVETKIKLIKIYERNFFFSQGQSFLCEWFPPV